MLSAEVIERIERERNAHEGDDVLGRSWALKRRFPHTLDNPARNELSASFHSALADTTGKDVLDFGCGKGEYALVAAQNGARVRGIDISSSYVEEARERVAAAGPLPGRAEFQVMDAHNLEFADSSFDLVIGNGILHHLDVPVALREVRRVLRPGGLAVFQEPLGDNPLLKLFRSLTPRARTDDERPFDGRQLREIGGAWQVESEYFGLLCAPLAMVTSVVMPAKPDNVLMRTAGRVEAALRRRHLLDSWHQYVLFRLRKRAD